jgi:hypothetical protein
MERLISSSLSSARCSAQIDLPQYGDGWRSAVDATQSCSAVAPIEFQLDQALIAAFGLLMLELSAYFALVQIWSAIPSAAILGVVNFGIAAILFAIAAKPLAGRELELANEIHGSSIDTLQLEARALQSQLSGVIHHPLNGILPLLIVQLITIIIRSLKNPGATAAPAAATAEQK